MRGSDGMGFFVILKKAVSWDLDIDEASWFFGPGRGQSSYGLGGAPHVVGSDGTVRIAKIVCLSLLVLKTWIKKGNKSFVSEPRESSLFRVFRIPMSMNILWTVWKFLCIHIFYVLIYGYVTIIPLSRILLQTWM